MNPQYNRHRWTNDPEYVWWFLTIAASVYLAIVLGGLTLLLVLRSYIKQSFQ